VTQSWVYLCYDYGIGVTEANDRQLSDDDLRDIVLNFLIAGRDTTAQALSWCFYRLCLNPDVAEEARKEIVHVLGKQNLESGPISFEKLQEMKYLEAVCMVV
jgi:cytochrome P450